MGGSDTTQRTLDSIELSTTGAGDAARPVDSEVVRRRLEPGQVKLRLICADTVAFMSGVMLAFAIQWVVRPVSNVTVLEHVLLTVVSIPGFAIGAGANRLYQSRANERPSQELRNLLRAVAVGVGVMLGIAFAVQFKHLSRLWVLLVVICVAVLVIVERRLARRLFRRMRQSGSLCRRILLIGTDPHAVGLLHTYERNPQLGYEVVGFVGNDPLGQRCGVGVLGPIDDLPRILAETDVSGVVISLASVAHDDVNVLTRRLTDEGIHVALSSTLTDIDVTRLRPQELDGRHLLYVEPVIRHGWRAVAKRVFDIVVAATILVVTAPLLVLAAIAIKIDSRGPVLYRQQRVGRHGRSFTMAKLRTMEVGADRKKAELAHLNEADGPLFKMANDPRVTRIGKLLRKTSLDEAPQLFSVLYGTMSMVGPRPALPEEVDQWDDALLDRLRVMPGVTGMWQVSGRSQASFAEYKRLDLYYVDNWSLAHDLRICAKTVGVVLTGRGAA